MRGAFSWQVITALWLKLQSSVAYRVLTVKGNSSFRSRFFESNLCRFTGKQGGHHASTSRKATGDISRADLRYSARVSPNRTYRAGFRSPVNRRSDYTWPDSVSGGRGYRWSARVLCTRAFPGWRRRRLYHRFNLRHHRHGCSLLHLCPRSKLLCTWKLSPSFLDHPDHYCRSDLPAQLCRCHIGRNRRHCWARNWQKNWQWNLTGDDLSLLFLYTLTFISTSPIIKAIIATSCVHEAG